MKKVYRFFNGAIAIVNTFKHNKQFFLLPNIKAEYLEDMQFSIFIEWLIFRICFIKRLDKAKFE